MAKTFVQRVSEPNNKLTNVARGFSILFFPVGIVAAIFFRTASLAIEGLRFADFTVAKCWNPSLKAENYKPSSFMIPFDKMKEYTEYAWQTTLGFTLSAPIALLNNAKESVMTEVNKIPPKPDDFQDPKNFRNSNETAANYDSEKIGTSSTSPSKASAKALETELSAAKGRGNIVGG